MNNSKSLTTLIVSGRNSKEDSQELARKIRIRNSSLNNIEKGRVIKPDLEIVKKIVEEIDLSLQQFLKKAGYIIDKAVELLIEKLKNLKKQQLNMIIVSCLVICRVVL